MTRKQRVRAERQRAYEDEEARQHQSRTAARSIAHLVRHAELFGCECVFETAWESGYSPLELGLLAEALRKVGWTHFHPVGSKAPSAGKRTGRWRLPTEYRERLALALLRSGVDIRRVVSFAGLSRETVQTLKDEHISGLKVVVQGSNNTAKNNAVLQEEIRDLQAVGDLS